MRLNVKSCSCPAGKVLEKADHSEGHNSASSQAALPGVPCHSAQTDAMGPSGGCFVQERRALNEEAGNTLLTESNAEFSQAPAPGTELSKGGDASGCSLISSSPMSTAKAAEIMQRCLHWHNR